MNPFSIMSYVESCLVYMSPYKGGAKSDDIYMHILVLSTKKDLHIPALDLIYALLRSNSCNVKVYSN